MNEVKFNNVYLRVIGKRWTVRADTEVRLEK